MTCRCMARSSELPLNSNCADCALVYKIFEFVRKDDTLPKRHFVFNALVMLALPCVLVACASLNVQVGYDESVDIGSLNTYSLTNAPNASTGNELVDDSVLNRLLSDAIDTEMVSKQYARVNSNPDFDISYQAVVEDREDVITAFEMDSHPVLYNVTLGYVPSGKSEDGTTKYIRVYQRGTLIITLTRPNTQEVMWRGSAHAEVRQAASDTERHDRITRAVRQILKSIPDSVRN